MSELTDNGTRARKDMLKHLIPQIHEVAAPEQVQR